jgi:hypothetical protein
MQQDVYEGDKITLRALETDQEVEFTVTNTDGKGKEEKKTSKEYEITFGPVPAKKENYTMSWKYKLPDQDGDISGEDTYRVWPKLLKLTVKMKAGAKGKVDGFTFNLIQGDAKTTPTVPSGSWSGKIEMKAYEISAVSPWVIEKKTESDDNAAEYTLEVSQTPWTAKILTQKSGTTDTDRWKQYVNLTDKAGSDEGSLMRVQVAPNDRSLGLKDQKISVRVTFPAKNSKRTTPRPALWVASSALDSKNPSGKPGVDELVYETQLSLPANGGMCEFDVQLGYAGGDKCTIEAGFDDGFGDDKLYVQNWRWLEAEFVVPHTAIRQEWKDLVNNDDSAPAPNDKLTAEIKAILDPLFIELDFPQDGRAVYTASDIDAVTGARGGSATFVFDGAKLSDKFAGKKAAFLAPSDLDQIRDRVLNDAVRGPLRMMLIWVDQMPKTIDDNNPGVEPVVVSEYGDTFQDTTAKAFTPQGSLLVAERNPLCTGGSDKWGIKHVTWRLQWRKEGGKTEDWSSEYWKAGEILGYTEAGDGVPGMPPEEYFSLSEVVPSTLAEVQKWVEFINARKFKINVPAADASEPGFHLGNDPAGVEIGAAIYVHLNHFKQGANANALNGKIRMTPLVGLGTPQGVARTLCHEIAHNLGHAYLENQGKATDGRGRQAKYKIPDIDFDPCIPDGIYYTGKGHAGPHCAAGIKKKDASLLSEKTFTDAKKFLIDTNCVLFGTGDQQKTVQFKFCEDCTRYILASDARDISTNWRA